MAGWDDILDEIKRSPLKNAVDEVRHQYLRRLSELTGRNTIAYYSSWLTRRVENTDINDNDMNGFMNTVRGLDCEMAWIWFYILQGGLPWRQKQLSNIFVANSGRTFA